MTTFGLYTIDKPPNRDITPAANLTANIERAIASYRRRHGGQAPNRMAIGAVDLPAGFGYNGLVIEPVNDKKLTKRHFRLWREEPKVEMSQFERQVMTSE